MQIVVDTNLIFSALASKNRKILLIIFDRSTSLYTATDLFYELFENKDKLCKASRLNEKEILDLFLKLSRRITAIAWDHLPREVIEESVRIMEGCDEKDTPFVAVALAMKAKLWTGDKRLKRCLEAKGIDICVDTAELCELLSIDDVNESADINKGGI